MLFLVKINLTVMVAKKFVRWDQMDVGIAQNVYLQSAGHAIKEVNNFGRLNHRKNVSKNSKK